MRGAARGLGHLARDARLLGGAGSGTVVVSTHFDDAVLSCWTVVAAGGDVTVVTVFTGGPDDDRVTDWDADTGVTSRERMAQRAAENEAALAVAGARAWNLGLVGRTYGGGSVGPEELREALAGATRPYVPAGTGVERVHPSHVRVRAACLALRPDAVLYADNPYSLFRAGVELPPELADRYERRVVALDEEQRRAKAAAIRCYAGELAKLERLYGPLTEPDRLPYEVFWEPR